ncbi:Glycerol dehydrogenase [Bacteroidales bacterium Barb4]|nr:Glycerol dehydrogenase [Bacteroidales bacterium Barb4]
MLEIISPREYVNRPDVLAGAGSYIKKYGKNVFILHTAKSLEVVKQQLFASLEKAGIGYELVFFAGYPNVEKAEAYASTYAKRIDAVIGIGGGRVIDMTKVLGNLLDVPIIAVPTVAATCAAWAAISILYTDEGRFIEVHANNRAPSLILADTRILMQSPVRYTYAGIIDTFAKWYELEPYLKSKQRDSDLLVTSDVAQRAFGLLIAHAGKAIAEAGKGIVSDAAVQTIDCILFLAGLAGSFKSDKPYRGAAHTFYNLSTQVFPAPQLLHGEKIAFGLVFQQVLLHKQPTEINETIRLFANYFNLFTLKDFRLGNHSGQKIATLAGNIAHAIQREYLPQAGFTHSKQEIEAALYEADRLIGIGKEQYF